MAKKKSQQDYRVAIPERHEISEFLQRSGAPRQLSEIAVALGINSSDGRAALNKRLKAMLRDGELIRNRREGYGLLDKMDLMAGRVIGHADGYGFFRPDRGGEDLFLSLKQMRSVLHGDRVVVRYGGFDRRKRREAVIVEVLERVNTTVVGRLYKEGSVAFVVADNKHISQDILIPPQQRKKAQAGDYVVTEITRQPDSHTQPLGRIVEVLGYSSSVDMAIEIAIRAYQVPHQWPDGVEDELTDLNREVPARGRQDLTKLPLVTIDGEDAMDFDDAIYCKKQGGEWRLVVAIADVSHYVRPGTALDKAAYERGNSVYFPNRVVPMLPELLSNHLCSLKPDTDRAAMVCDLRVNPVGRVKQCRLYPAVIRSRARMTYNLVNDILAGAKVYKKYKFAVPCITDMHELFRVMRVHREQQGLLDFSSNEIRMSFDAQSGRVTAINAIERGNAHRIIEEFMLATNRAVAEFLLNNNIPAIFRNHTVPEEEKIDNLNEFLADFGLQLGGGQKPKTIHYAKVLKLIETREDRHLIETVLLRSMPQAVYEGRNKGHFGLAFEHYTHFTSPIRRYPDLLVHRAVRHIIDNEVYEYDKDGIYQAGVHCSMTERRAEEAVRDVTSRMKCEFMLDKIGQAFPGIISGVTGFGLFVELDDIYVEGLVHISALPADYYHFNPIAHSLSGERTGRKYFLGDRIRVKLLSVNADERKIDFEYVK